MNRRTFLALGALAFMPRFSTDARLVAFGDSITSGYLAVHPYAPQVATAIGRTLDNRAVAGSHAAEQAAVIGATALDAGDVAMWLCGYNDMRAGTPLETFRATVDAALADLVSRAGRVVIGNCLRMTAEGYALPIGPYGSDARAAEINAILADICQARGAQLVDVSAAYDPTNVQADLVHPNEAGHAQIALAFVAGLLPYRQQIGVVYV